MDLVQRKLTRDEWNSVEVPVYKEEKDIINLITKGYTNINVIENYNNSIMDYLRIEHTNNMDNHLYKTYFMETIKEHVEKYNLNFDYTINNNSSKIKKIDSLRLEKSNTEVLKKKREEIFDYLLLLIIGKILKYKNSDNKRWNYYYYSLYKIKDYKVKNINKKVITYVKYIIDLYMNEINLLNMIEKSTSFIFCSFVFIFMFRKYTSRKHMQSNIFMTFAPKCKSYFFTNRYS